MISKQFGYVVLQPTTVCNADCTYCYLLHRHENLLMPIEVVEAVARAIEEQNQESPVNILWHGGEPTAVGLKRFEMLVKPFERLIEERRATHIIQTNGVLINDQWCEFFTRHGFNVGVSIDGPKELNVKRVDRAGKPIFDMIMRGIECLKKHTISFGVIAVVNAVNVHDPEGFYQFFVDLGCSRLNINVEEQEGANSDPVALQNDDVVRFWKQLFAVWRRNPVLPIREFEKPLEYARHVLQNTGFYTYSSFDPFPTVAWNGDVTVLSPELAGVDSERYANFVVGNVLKKSLNTICEDCSTALYAREYVEGVEKCRQECAFFAYCGGGQAANKFFELGTINTTETAFCRNSKQAPFLAILDSI